MTEWIRHRVPLLLLGGDDNGSRVSGEDQKRGYPEGMALAGGTCDRQSDHYDRDE